METPPCRRGLCDLSYFHDLNKHGASFLVRGGKSLNPTVSRARNGKGRALPKLAGKNQKVITRRANKSEVLDLTIYWKNLECRLIRRWLKEENPFLEYYGTLRNRNSLIWINFR